MSRFGKVFWLGATLPGLLGFDYWSKEWVRTNLAVGQEIEVVPGWLSLLHAENPGILFSLPVPVPLIFVVGLVGMGLLVWAWRKLPRQARLPSAAIGAIAAGALGNLFDRVPDGHVTDMVMLYTESEWLTPVLLRQFGTATWPIFNVADVALLAGVLAWTGHDWWETRRRRRARPPAHT